MSVHPEPIPFQIPAAERRFRIAIRLTTGDLVAAGEAEDADKAAALGYAVTKDVTQAGDEWPFFDGRFINPETIVSVDLLADA